MLAHSAPLRGGSACCSRTPHPFEGEPFAFSGRSFQDEELSP
jgi:hypothetical protein